MDIKKILNRNSVKNSFFILAIIAILSCSQSNSTTTETRLDSSSEEAVHVELENSYNKTEVKYKEEIPELEIIKKKLLENKDSLIVLAKVPGQNALIKVVDGNWPDDIQTVYNIIKDKEGFVIFISEYPVSESGDWNLSWNHYYTEQGLLIAFEKRLAFFNGPCDVQSVTIETLVKLYDENLNEIKSVKIITDKDGKLLDEECGENLYDQEYEIKLTVTDFMALKDFM